MTKRRVLVIEDDELTNKALTVLVRALGHDCTSVRDGEAALSLVDEIRPEVVLVDIHLRGIDGYEIARRLRRDRAAPLYLAAITGWEPAYNPALAIEAGFDRHVLKPPPVDTIQAILAHADSILG